MIQGLIRKDDMWTPYKELQSIVDAVIAQPQEDMLKKLEETLRNHKQNFLTLLTNPPKNSVSREELRKGINDGIDLPGVGHQVLSKDLVDEALIISDMYNLNEHMALDLLCTAQQQMPFHPGLTRGLVAVLLYYDGRKAIVSALRTLVQSRQGISWAVESTDSVVAFVTRYTQELVENGLMGKILNLIETLDLSKEIELLQQNRALGGPRHHRQVTDLFQGIRQTLADVMYFWAAQSGLPKESTLALINQLKATTIQEDPKGGIDGVTLTLQMALLYALDLSILQKREDGEEVIQKLPLIAEPDFITCLLRELLPGGSCWCCPGLQAITHLACGLAIAALRMAPQNLHPTQFQDEDDTLVDSAVDLKVFEFLHRTFLNNASVCREEFYLRRLHTLMTDFVVFMPLKVKELRIRAEETARTMQMYAQEGLEPPASLPHHYEHLLLTVAFLYQKDPLHLDLIADYWCPADGLPAMSYPYRSPPIQVSLYKFVRSSGDLLPPSLFVPYMKMLCSLSSSPKVARHAFNLLKQPSPGHTTNVSWDHFFSSLNQYYSNLRQELPATTDPIYRHHNFPRSITPQEVTCLQAVLKLIKVVAENDEFSRVALCDNVNWSPLSVLLGLVSCSISIPLKADLLTALAALARSPDTAATLWHNLEASQVLTTVPSTSSYQPRGIQTELEELESRNEEFPLTRAMLHLLDVLTDVPVPRLLGVGSRVPGFEPYLRFVLNSVFAKFHTRSYKNPEEKWEIGKSCLQLFVKFLGQYEPHAEDFRGGRVELQGGGSTQVQPHPGFHIMVNLNSPTELLRLVLFLLDEGCNWLDTYSSFPGKEALESALLACLALVDKALVLQQRFFSLLSSSGSSLLLTGLGKLLLGINPRSGKPDHLLNVAKYVTYNGWLPRHALLAASILLSASTYPPSLAQLLDCFTSAPDIRHGFVESLEADGAEEGEEEDEMGVQDRTKEAVLRLLQRCLNHPAPNVAHHLLGFDVNKELRKTVFQQPGILGFPRTCLHSLIAMLDASLHTRHFAPLNPAKPRLVELAYAVLHALCSNSRTSEPTLRFLRASGDLLARHTACLPFVGGADKASELNQMAWLLRMLAIEVKVLCSKSQHSQLSSVVHLLVVDTDGDDTAQEKKLKGEQDAVALNHLSSHLSKPSASTEIMKAHYPLLLGLLVSLDLTVAPVPAPAWEYFEPTQIAALLVSCEAPKTRQVDVKRLHRTLMDELTALQHTSTAGQRQVIVQEIQLILRHALKLNSQRANSTATVRFLDSWRQLTETLFSVTPRDVLSGEYRQQLLLSSLLLLLNKVLKEPTLPEVATLVSGAVLLLMVALRQCYSTQTNNSSSSDGSASTEVPKLAHANIASLKVILSNLLEWILGSGVTSQTLRANLYASLLSFLHMTCLSPEPAESESAEFVSRLDSTRLRWSSAQRQASVDVITGFSIALVDVLCHDCAGGHDVCKMLALSCLDVLVALDTRAATVEFLSSRGYIKHLVDGLLTSDEKLTGVLDAVPDSLRPLYIYESKMAVLCRIASTHTGAETLLEQCGLACLSSMTVFDRHPDVRPNFVGMDIDFVPSVGQRYMQILFPALDLCDTVLSSLGSDNQSSNSQIMSFLMSHNEIVSQVLRSGSPSLQSGYLKELAKLTGIIARSSKGYPDGSSGDIQVCEGAVRLQRLHKQMLSLFSRFIVTDNVTREPTCPPGGEVPRTRRDSSEATLSFLQVACHLVLYARNKVASRTSDHRASSVVFRPGLVGDDGGMKGRENYSIGESNVPSLGVAVQQLVQCVRRTHKEVTALDVLMRKHTAVPNMNTLELKEFLSEDTMEQIPILESRTRAKEQLDVLLANKRQELKYYSFLIENCLYLVWCHVDYYMLRAIPKSSFNATFDRSTGEGLFMSIHESTWQVTTEEVSQLKQGLLSIFNDTFIKELVDTKQEQSSMDKGFVEALVRRIKRLIQFVPVK